MADHNYAKGGSFLTATVTPQQVFTPEDFTSDQLMYAKTAKDFFENEVLEAVAEIEAKNFEVSKALLRKSGELGLLMADVPEAHGGLELDKVSGSLITENLTGLGAFQCIWGTQTGIGMLPIVYYGTEEQKSKYLPEMVEGKKIGCYCLTEPSAGSDAMAGRCKAELTEDGAHYILNGTKQFITNGGLADIFIVFAKVDGDKYTGFILEKGTPGLSVGPEEHKLGIRGSSTTTVILEDARVPVENLLGEIGQGHKIAFNILNVGRYKLGVAALGSAKRALNDSITYSLERKQFGRRLAEFEVIREKLAQMYVRIYAAEAAAYRTVGMIDNLQQSGDDHGGDAALQSIEEYNAECAMIKVLGSEALDYVVDENVQIHGGYGFCAEYPAERYYRDSRINRIFEGTNEINRIIVPTQLLRKSASGYLDIFARAEALTDRLSRGLESNLPEGSLGAEQLLVSNLKKIAILLLGKAGQKYGKAIAAKQALLMRLSDIVMATYEAESALLRALKDVERRGEDGAALPVAAAKITCATAMEKAQALARQCLVSLGEELADSGLDDLVDRSPSDTIALREVIAAKLVEMERLVI